MSQLIMDGILPGEEILPDDYPVHWDFTYVCDGHVRYSPLGNGATVAALKAEFGVSEIRRCDQKARGLLEH